MWASIIGNYFKLGLYTTEQAKIFVQASWITAADYKQITGTEYAA